MLGECGALADLVASIGFPIAISVYLLLTRDRVISKNTEAINDLKNAINRTYK